MPESTQKILRIRRDVSLLGDLAMDMPDTEVVIKDEENCCGFEERSLLIHTQPAWFIPVRDKLLEFYSATCYDIEGDNITCLDGC